MTAKRFLLIASYGNSLINFRWHFMKALQDAGFEVHAAAPDLPAHSEVRQWLEARNVRVHEIPMQRNGLNPLRDLVTLHALFRLMRRLSPTHTMGYTIKPVLYGALAARLARVPRRFCLITGLGYVFSDQPAGLKRRLMRTLVERLYRLAIACCHKVFFQNPDDLALFRERGLLGRTPAVVVNGSGVDTRHFAPVPLPEAPSFVLISRLLGDKGVREYAEAARQIRAEHPQARFQLVGYLDANPDAITDEELQRWIADGRLEYLGRLKDVRPALAASSTFVLPSAYREGVPRTILEALAMGRAIITTDMPGCRETVHDGDNGYLVAPRSVPSLVLAIRRMIEQPVLLERMGRRSREIALDKYDVTRVNAVMLKEMGVS
ncbi:glycosyltransferase family 4 protein [Halomonas mongoliensis]|uniref:glycosyltransferase family 4 protein n=1 Tax=Halomonas mongoliensis TaxID=321265 RepID=UPI00403AF40F